MIPKHTLKYWIGVLVLLIVGFTACEEEIIKADSTVDKTYYPLIIGNYVVYQLDSIIYDDFDGSDTTITLFVRELVESKFIDAGGNEVYRIERAYKRSLTNVWGSAGYDIWYANFTGNNAEKVEENQRYIKLAFPLRLGKEWLGNQYINTQPISDGGIDSMIENPLVYLDGWMYEVTALNEAKTIGNLSFDSTVTVVQHQYGIQTDTIGGQEIYAKNIGLIYKDLWVLSTQCNRCNANDTACKLECFNSPWLDKAEAGFVLKMKAIEYGAL
ncbi:MAG: hypothetical protein R2730_05580 [Chitinophagales bacterium]